MGCEAKQYVLRKLQVFSGRDIRRDIRLRLIIDIAKLKYPIDNNEDFELGSMDQDKAGQLTLLKKYYESFSQKGWCKMTYQQKKPFGRYFTSKMGLQNLSKKIRHTVSSKLMYDINKVNPAQPCY